MEECKINVIHEDKENIGKNNIVNEDEVFDLSDLFKIFGDSTRIKIIMVLLNNRMCVCDISDTLKMSQSAVSHQLRILRTYRLVKNEKVGKEVYYSLNDDHVEEILKKGIEHIREEK